MMQKFINQFHSALVVKYKKLTIIGTSHISKQSLKQVEDTINKIKPEIIALELDKKRYLSLVKKVKRKLSLKDIKSIGIKGYIFNLIGAWIERKLGKLVGVRPGAEMLKAASLAHKHKAKIALIDQDIEVTLRRLSKSITFKEKWNFFVDIIKGLFFGKREMKKLGIKKMDLTKVPSKRIIKKLIKKVKERYPSVYKVLVEERNHVLAANLRHVIREHPDSKIVAVIGAGHEEDVLKLVKKGAELVTYSLKVG
jgi:pheromone shutdown-related protein TraB